MLVLTADSILRCEGQPNSYGAVRKQEQGGVSGMGDVATQNLFALLGDEGEDPLADFSQPKQEVKEKKKPASAAPAEGRPGSDQGNLLSVHRRDLRSVVSVLTRCWSGGQIGRSRF